MNEQITLHLTRDEALVLFEFFARFQETDDFRLEHNAECIAFGHLAGQIDKAVVEPLTANYTELLSQARERLEEGHEGLAPGVRPQEYDAEPRWFGGH